MIVNKWTEKGVIEMNIFNDIIGHEDIKRYFNKAIETHKVAHSYIFEGIEGVGKKTIALAVAKALLCQDGDVPCGQCKACIMVDAGTHPDIVFVEKDTKVTKIQTIRDQVVKNMEIKPYQGRYKIMMINDADSITAEGQNAMLKTIEEPPSYGIIILITKNLAKLLPTIRSRCIHLRFNPLNREEIETYLKDKPIDRTQKEILKQFSEGSIGVANQLIEDTQFLEMRQTSIERLNQIERADLIGVYRHVKELVEHKENLIEILQFWLLWYRDLAMVKVGEREKLYYVDYEGALLDTSSKLTYNMICKHMDLIKETTLQIQQNINSTLAIENLLLKIKEKRK